MSIYTTLEPCKIGTKKPTVHSKVCARGKIDKNTSLGNISILE
ncbi:hypothetical protein MNB_SM-4-76 [hydrothermal vent metagenome]|uniref:Uncharacterized protein n=1 Tax=hydrothermal vent metagenome TaxID=652676 RepID=A0A1W1B961_9ZZZZ